MTFSRRKILTTIPGIVGIVALAGCGSKTTSSWSVDSLQSEAQVVDKFVTTVIASLESSGHISADQKTAINAIEAKVASIITSMSAASGQTLTIDTGKTWAKSLISEIQQLLAIAEPIAAQYSTQIATYLQLGSGLITIIQTIVGMTTTSARYGSTPADRNVINAAVYKGIGA
mgnify:FL=1